MHFDSTIGRAAGRLPAAMLKYVLIYNNIQLNPHLTCKWIRHRNLLWQEAYAFALDA